MCFRSVHVSVSRSRFAACGYTLFLKDCVAEENFMQSRLELWNLDQREFACDKFRPSKKMRNSFVLTVGVGKDRLVLWIARVLLLFHLNPQARKGGTTYAFLK